MKSHHVVTVGAMLLGIFCVNAGILKIWKSETFEVWNYPPAWIFVVGVIEILSAVLIFLPITRRYGAFGLACLMVLAILTHIYNGNVALVPVPVVLLLLSGFIACRYKTNLRKHTEPSGLE